MTVHQKALKAGPSVLRKLRSEWQERWHVEWPHDDAYLSELWREAKEAYGLNRRSTIRNQELRSEVYEFAQDLMDADMDPKQV